MSGVPQVMTDNAKIINQLRALVLLTQTEEQVARTRVSQARTEAVRRELTQNADNAAERTRAITDQLRALGGVPDVVTPAVGRLSAVLKAGFEQAEPLEEALLQDLNLEHQLLDRATYVKVLAEQAELPKVRQLAERLITAHKATVEWLTVVLAEEALGGPAALQATALQRDAGTAARTAREELGDVSADELPIKGYDSLSTQDAIKAVKELKSAHDVRVIIRYEETHKNRTSVVNATQTQLAALAKEAVGVSE